MLLANKNVLAELGHAGPADTWTFTESRETDLTYPNPKHQEEPGMSLGTRQQCKERLGCFGMINATP